MDSQGAANPQFNFGAMDFDSFSVPQAAYNVPKNAEMDNTFFGDEGIDTSGSFGTVDQQFDSLFPLSTGLTNADFGMPLALDNTSASASWGNTTFPPTPVQSFDSMYTPQLSSTALGKRPLQLDVQDFPQPKRHEGLGGLELGFPSYPTSSSVTGSSWTVDTLPTPSSSNELLIGLSDEAADVCATWFGKYNVLPSDRHIDSLSQLTGEPVEAIRKWFGQALKQGLGQDSAYKSQTSFTQEPLFHSNSAELIEQPVVPQPIALEETQATTTPACIVQAPVRGGKKGCHPTSDPELLKRDPNKIYQCTRKCGKRYGRKCDWKRNEEEGYPSKSWVCSLCIEQNTERVKPCFRKYHFSQHFRNVHPGVDSAEYEEASRVQNDTAFPRKCGFCAHRFVSRQDRIDHIADHFKEGKCMLDWNDDESNDSENTEDDDDNNNGDDGQDSSDSSDNQSFFPPGDDQYNSGSGSSKDNGGSDGKQHYYQNGLYQFQLSQSDEVQGVASQHIIPETRQHSCSCDYEQSADDAGGASRREKQCINPASEYCKYSTTGVDSVALARDVVPLLYSDGTNASSLSDQLYKHINDDRNLAISLLMSIGTGKPGNPSSSRGDGNGGCSGTQIDWATNNGVLWIHGKPGAGKSTLMKHTLEHCRWNLRTLNALLALLDPTQHQPPILPPPLPSPENDVKDVSLSSAKSWAVSEHALSALLQQDKMLDSSASTTLQHYWKGITTLLDHQSFVSVKLLGTGGFSTVDEVVHRETGLRISRKTLKNRQQSAVDELKKEVDTLQKLRHPHIIRIVGAVSNGNKMSILLTPVAETTLAVWLEEKSLTKPAGLSQIIVKMLGCLSSTVRYLHEQRPVVKHMDIKPQNILVKQGSQEFPHVVLSDFGISSSDDHTTLVAKSTPVTRQYCAPEVSGGLSREKSSDIWSLGCVFAEMVTVAFSNDHEQWRAFRSQFLGHKTSYYSQDIPALQNWLTKLIDPKMSSLTETTVVSTVQAMLSAEPTMRPDAAMLALIFTPAPCCLSWPNEQASFPGPLEEMETVKAVTKEEGVDWQDLHGCATDKQLPVQANAANDTTSSAKKWLFECSLKHEACHHRRPGTGARVLPTRLVDMRPDGVENEGSIVRIMNSADCQTSVDEPVAYAALSYTWGDSEFKLSTQHEQNVDLPRKVLSTGINEAISTASRIGYRYLWVDSLCVQQDSLPDIQRECVAMRDVYRNSDLTLVLIGNNGKLQATPVAEVKSIGAHGPIDAPLKTIDYNAPAFAWDTRAWSLQERLLSRRLLHLGQQLYWECNELKASETFPVGMPPLLWEKVHTKTPVFPVETKISTNCCGHVKSEIQHCVVKQEVMDRKLKDIDFGGPDTNECGTVKKMGRDCSKCFVG